MGCHFFNPAHANSKGSVFYVLNGPIFILVFFSFLHDSCGFRSLNIKCQQNGDHNFTKYKEVPSTLLLGNWHHPILLPNSPLREAAVVTPHTHQDMDWTAAGRPWLLWGQLVPTPMRLIQLYFYFNDTHCETTLYTSTKLQPTSWKWLGGSNVAQASMKMPVHACQMTPIAAP